METFYPILAEVRLNEQDLRKYALHVQGEKDSNKQSRILDIKHFEDAIYQLYLTFKHYLNVK